MVDDSPAPSGCVTFGARQCSEGGLGNSLFSMRVVLLLHRAHDQDQVSRTTKG
jgi:hypothetical protein